MANVDRKEYKMAICPPCFAQVFHIIKEVILGIRTANQKLVIEALCRQYSGWLTVSTVAEDKAAITALFKRYQILLNASDTASIMELYTADGVFMAQNLPTAVGIDAVRKAYDKTFAAITLSAQFEIIEIMPVTDKWAFARTASAGTVKFKAGGEGLENNQELFVLQKDRGKWKIARYSFSSTNPPH